MPAINLFYSFKKSGILLSILFFTLNIFGQVTFERYYGGMSDEEGNSVVQTADGGFILAGYTKSFGAGSSDLYIVRVNTNGDTVWTRTIGGTGYDNAVDITNVDDNHYLIGGYVGTGNGDIFLVKINDIGNVIWTKTIGTADNDHLKKIKKTPDGGFIICGDITALGDYKYLLVKTNSSGDTLWTKAYNYGTAYSIDVTNDGGFILGVDPFEVPYFTDDFLLVKTSPDGDIEWTKTYGGPETEVPYAVGQTSDGGYFIAGRTDSYGAGGSDFYLLKTNSGGDSLWAKTYGGEADERAFAAIQTSDDGYIMAGYTFADVNQYFDFYLVKTDLNGNLQWTRTYGGVWQEVAYEIKETEDGYAIVGYTQSYGEGGFDMYFVKTDKNGLLTGTVDNENNLCTGFQLYQNFPDPFNPSTTIRFQLPEYMHASLKIYDILGREVETLIKGELGPGPHNIVFNPSTYSSGVYFYQLKAVSGGRQTRDLIQTKKMILLK